jgi:hypothetical protein
LCASGSSAVGVAQLLALLLEKYGGQTKENAWKVNFLTFFVPQH